MRAARRGTARGRPLLWTPLVFVVAWMMIGTAAASGGLTWRAPYHGNLHSTHHIQHGPCGVANFGGLTLKLTNGHVVGGASVDSSAACNPNSSALQDVDASVGLDLQSFNGTGNFTVVVKWKLDFQVGLTISGSNCQPGTYAIASLGFGMLLDNVSNGSAADSNAHVFLFKLTSVGAATHVITANVTVKFSFALDPSVSYDVVPGVSFAIGSDAPPPAPPATSSCAADVSLKAGASSGLATLVYAAVH